MPVIYEVIIERKKQAIKVWAILIVFKTSMDYNKDRI